MLFQLSYEAMQALAKYPKDRRFDSHSGQANFSACPVWI
jgi:hypothetical protein